jgi:mannitol 2-dehydrogenase
MTVKSVKLNQHNLPDVKPPVSVPRYDRSKLRESIVHIGLGHFHRAHQVAYLEDLLNRGIADSGIFEMNIVPDSFPVADILAGQDHLYTLITKNPAGEAGVKITGAIKGYLNASADKGRGVARLADDRTDLVTLTVTENGYYYDKKTGAPDLNDPAVRNDLEKPSDPRTAAGFIAAALALRYKNGRKPLTVMSCDNIPANGAVLKTGVLAFCRELYPDIVPWIGEKVSFPCSMVDRITPGTTKELISELEERYGVSDGWPVCGEDFIQWVLEDDFRTPVPDYAAAGVQVVKDVEPYEFMKMRLLNGSHAALGFTSYLMGFRMVDEAITNPLIGRFIRDHYMEEVTPTLAPVPGIDLKSYKDTLVSRFSNKNIADTILRLTDFSPVRFTNFVLKPLSNTIQRRLPHKAVTFAVAGCARFLTGTDEKGNPIPINNVDAEELKAAAAKARTDPKDFLKIAGTLYLSDDEMAGFEYEFKECLGRIYDKGTEAALMEVLS